MVNDTSRERVVHAVLERQAAQHGGRTFLYFKDKEFSYQAVNQAANRVARGLQKMRIRKGDKVAIMLDNCPEFLFLWFGLSKLGAVEVPINTAHKGDLLAHMLDISDSCMLVMDNKFTDRVRPVLANLPNIQTVIIYNPFEKGTPRFPVPQVDWNRLVDNDGNYSPEEVLWSDPCSIVFTSGTTGPSKGPLLPHNHPISMGELAVNIAGLDERDRLYNTLPLFHVIAQNTTTIPAIMSGGSMVLAERFSASTFWEDVKRYGCTAVSYVGSILSMLLKANPKPYDSENPVRVMLGVGCPMDVFNTFEKRFGVILIEYYGMSEIGIPLINTLKDRKPGTCGKPSPDYVVKVMDDNCMELGPNTVGELLVRPLIHHYILKEYINMPEKTLEAFQDLWFHTGDYAYYDEEGYFYFVDRKKDALRRRGENISSYEVEKVINSHPAVLESAVIAAKPNGGEDEVMACLTLKPGKTLTPPELMTYCEERMAYFMIPRYLRFMGSLPKTATGRVQKYSLRKEGVTPDTWDRETAGYKLKR